MCSFSQSNQDYRIGDVYLMKFEGTGSEQSGWRPGLIFQNNRGNFYSPNIIALPFTSSLKKLSQPTHVFIAAKDSGLVKDSIVLCENPERISKERIGAYLTTLTHQQMRLIAVANLLATSAIAFIDPHDLTRVRDRAIALNVA